MNRSSKWYSENREDILARRRVAREANHDEYKAKARAYYRANRAKLLSSKRHHSTGWTAEMFSAAWEEQKGMCALCGIAMQPEGRGALSVHGDHCHMTGRPRALLHNRCNVGLGYYRDDPALLERAAEYVRGYAPSVVVVCRSREERDALVRFFGSTDKYIDGQRVFSKCGIDVPKLTEIT